VTATDGAPSLPILDIHPLVEREGDRGAVASGRGRERHAGSGDAARVAGGVQHPHGRRDRRDGASRPAALPGLIAARASPGEAAA
jgi:hypothetical protein